MEFAGGRSLRVGVGGPVGSGHGAGRASVQEDADDSRIAVVTNDIYTRRTPSS